MDGDDPAHIQWVYQKSLERAAEFSITGVTYRLTQGKLTLLPLSATEHKCFLKCDTKGASHQN